MGMASHLGPWLLGTVKSTTGTSTGQIRNMGATVVNQSITLTYSSALTGNAFVLPAGALITGTGYYATTAFTGGGGTTATVVLKNGSTNLTATQPIFTAPATSTPNFNSAAASALSIGSTDTAITYALAYTDGTNPTTPTQGSVVVWISYVVRNVDGSYNYSSTSSATVPSA